MISLAIVLNFLRIGITLARPFSFAKMAQMEGHELIDSAACSFSIAEHAEDAANRMRKQLSLLVSTFC